MRPPLTVVIKIRYHILSSLCKIKYCLLLFKPISNDFEPGDILTISKSIVVMFTCYHRKFRLPALGRRVLENLSEIAFQEG